ncbi:glycoside hydrolase family 27 protein [Aulographum hederae CBS 113979]|uniref:Alpha-galactosidase n=1 Tax=Aulographum hederae CBS 113979 TaxID=1176131 RepID=A0A6G1H0Z9_9PEZI|nr:glycoside hydrolase family 27 protein [Aulographum hederae CBS 113979]
MSTVAWVVAGLCLLPITQAELPGPDFRHPVRHHQGNEQVALLGAAPSAALVRPNDVGRLPALGWNSWNAFNCDINEEKFLTAAQKMIDLGFKDAGYEYVNIDDCWSIKDHRDEKTKRMIPDPERFPEGISGTANKIHDMGLKIGIYSSAGTKTCAGYPASIGYETIDAEAWAEWGIDYLKYDNCNVPQNWTDECNFCVPDADNGSLDYINGTCMDDGNYCPPDYDWSKSNTAKRYQIMSDALLAQDRVILYSLCEWGHAGVQYWGNTTAASWRSTGDINTNWDRVLEIFNENSFWGHYTDFWGHSDPDMLEVGNGDSMTPNQWRTHFAMWAAMKSPLLIGADLSNVTDEAVKIMLNKPLLDFNQDPVVGKPAMPYKWGTNADWTFNKTYPAEFWAGRFQQGVMVLMFNPYDATKEKVADFGEIPGLEKGASYKVTDAWTGDDLGCRTGSVLANVGAYDTAVLVVGEKCYGQGNRVMERMGEGFIGRDFTA